jgi:hypothetical protein
VPRADLAGRPSGHHRVTFAAVERSTSPAARSRRRWTIA